MKKSLNENKKKKIFRKCLEVVRKIETKKLVNDKCNKKLCNIQEKLEILQKNIPRGRN